MSLRQERKQKAFGSDLVGEKKKAGREGKNKGGREGGREEGRVGGGRKSGNLTSIIRAPSQAMTH